MKDLNYDIKDTAILCVDCQNGFTLRCPEELPVEGTDEKWIEKVNEFIAEAKDIGYTIIASKDDHPENHKSFNEWPPHCIKGTYGNELFIKHYDFLVKKGTTENTDSYSAFYEDMETKNETELDKFLRENNFKKLIIFGLAGDVCVLATIKTAIKKGYDVAVIEDFIKSVNGKSMKEILDLEKLKVNIEII
ncbi:isochorismatase [Marinitoga sp. 1135]|nr:isochorismatase [Marinitoga sp. 1137]NUU95372.1 isochorismatase [Marinitoga sp. 1135]NUU97300.1 isochorismatase [Marinitoga sp. 1138]